VFESEHLVIAAIFALAGALIGVTGSVLVEHVRARADVYRRHGAALQEACAEFASALVHVRHLSLRVRDEGDPDREIEGRIRASYEEAWRAYVRIQLLSNSERMQHEARYAIRHAWGFSQEMTTGIDPRTDEYPSEAPGVRLTESLRRFYVEARRELGVKAPDAVALEPPDWDRHPSAARHGQSSPPAGEVAKP
jgi:hypothetical protein